MTRSIVTALVAALGVGVLSGSGCAPSGVGDPCTPEQEFDPTFIGFNVNEVSTESKSFQCLTRVCLVNHFQGRVSCPYGQAKDGSPNPGAQPYPGCSAKNPVTQAEPGCCTPGIPQPVTGPLDTTNMPVDTTNQQTVLGQCAPTRTADEAVYCSCRCANVTGGTDDGAVYCSCPDGFTCTQLVSAIQSGAGAQNTGLTGAYCVKNGTQFDVEKPCSACDPLAKNCGSLQL